MNANSAASDREQRFWATAATAIEPHAEAISGAYWALIDSAPLCGTMAMLCELHRRGLVEIRDRFGRKDLFYTFKGLAARMAAADQNEMRMA